MSEVATSGWRKSSWSAYNGNCVEVAAGARPVPGLANTVIGIRDSQEAALGDARTVLQVPWTVWREFTAWLTR
jgi:hypothetical protein